MRVQVVLTALLALGGSIALGRTVSKRQADDDGGGKGKIRTI